MRLAYLNGALWALGNGLGSTALIIYLARQLGAAGLAIGVVLAAPQLVGVLRLASQGLAVRIGGRRLLCVACFAASAILLAAISQLAEPGQLNSPAVSLRLVTSLWCVYHLLEYIGTVLLWAWLGDITVDQTRGRFIGVRERYMLVGRVVGMLAAGGFAWSWAEFGLGAEAWVGYSVPAGLAAAFMLIAVLPLLRMPDVASAVRGPPKDLAVPQFFAPLADQRMRWLLAFGVWFSVANGLTQSAQFLFPIVVFVLPLLARNTYTSGMRLGQAALAPAVGKAADSLGTRRVLIAAQLIVATGPLFFIAAARVPQTAMLSIPLPWWILAGAWVAWIGYVGLNVGLPNLILKISGPDQRASYIAWYFAVTGVVYGASTIAGGAIYSWLDELQPTWHIVSWALTHHDLLFVGGFVLRIMSVLCLLPLSEAPRLPPSQGGVNGTK